ncbi:uncharacterized protein LOC130101636 [Rhinichthys klamathensis goyatoka]|uniref:uncharacterized protein LOC130101636 n=1 Tax=Rhinichthys klamathensis goyatoka TaxID=3034132 RepID=UPI0024B482B0|nr:uncharacterized protein LOC130101636 [Rhinichthys klamathensis goyatoka]
MLQAKWKPRSFRCKSSSSSCASSTPDSYCTSSSSSSSSSYCTSSSSSSSSSYCTSSSSSSSSSYCTSSSSSSSSSYCTSSSSSFLFHNPITCLSPQSCCWCKAITPGRKKDENGNACVKKAEKGP